jgi:Domain of unknown function (DUF1905)
MAACPTITFIARLQRKQATLPVYIVIPHTLVASWGLTATAVVGGTIDGHDFGRRTIKRWDSTMESDWFVEFTAPLCKAAGILEGDHLAVSLNLVSREMKRDGKRSCDKRRR